MGQLPRLLRGLAADRVRVPRRRREFFREDRGVSLAPQWLVLSAQASDYELPYITPENIDQESFVDWVRVWRL